jgi:copper homeostasis protein (lipoprotein)
MKPLAFWSLLAASLLCLGACQKQVPDPDFNPDPAHNSANSLDWAGVYKGVLPCADCMGIETQLELKSDLTYVLQTRYLGRSEEPLTEQGHFIWNEAGSKIRLQHASDGVSHYRVGENILEQLDIDGKTIGDAPMPLQLLKIQDLDSLPLVETRWQLQALMGKPVSVTKGAQTPYLAFQASGLRLSGFGGCNQLMGNYEVQPHQRLRFTQIAATEKFCLTGMETEDALLKVLGQVDSFQRVGNRLQLLRARMAPLAELEAVGPVNP